MFDLEKKYWNFQDDLDLFEYIIPMNLREQKQKFITALRKNTRYNPYFEYKNIRFNFDEVIRELIKMRKEFEALNNIISFLYVDLIEEDMNWIRNFAQRESNKFPEYLTSLFGKPDKKLFEKAVATIKILKKNTRSEHQIDSIEMKKLIEKKIADKNIKDWKIVTKESSSRIAVSSIRKEIIINMDSYFGLSEIERLLVHEIGTHVLRYENGMKQKYMIFRKGFPGYLKTEEGLAILSESKNNLLSPKDLSKYCARLITAYSCFEYDFWDLFNQIQDYLDTNDSFDVVARIKRGLINTDYCGGFTKDQIYFKGFIEVSNLPMKKIENLYIGKIGVEHLSLINQMDDINFDIEFPKWIKND